jgi:hypothetical protein
MNVCSIKVKLNLILGSVCMGMSIKKIKQLAFGGTSDCFYAIYGMNARRAHNRALNFLLERMEDKSCGCFRIEVGGFLGHSQSCLGNFHDLVYGIGVEQETDIRFFL